MPVPRRLVPHEELNSQAACNLLGRVQYAIELVRLGADRRLVLHELYAVEKFVGIPIVEPEERGHVEWIVTCPRH